MIVKAITVTQPWATLLAIGAKRIETRSWSTAYRGPLAISASKSFPEWAQSICLKEPFWTALRGIEWQDLPTGCGIAIGTLRTCKSISLESELPLEPEPSFGNYETGRWAWLFDSMTLLKTPVPCRGSLSLWDWNPPVAWRCNEENNHNA